MSNHTSELKISIGSICVENFPVTVNFECDSNGDYIYIESVITEIEFCLFDEDNEESIIPAGSDILYLVRDKDLDNLVDQIYKNF